jgi:hypothetical protein
MASVTATAAAHAADSATRDFTQEQQDFAVQQGVLTKADAIIRSWENGESLIKRTIATLTDSHEGAVNYSSQIKILREESEKLTRLFDETREILIHEPTCCYIRQSTILSWGTSLVGLLSGTAGMGTIAYDYINQQAPSVAPIILTAGGVAVVGFQVLILNRMKAQQEERSKLLLLRGRCEIITQAREMSRILELLMRKGDSASGVAKALDADKFRLLRKQMQVCKDRIASSEVSAARPMMRTAATAVRSDGAPHGTERRIHYSARELINATAIAEPCVIESISRSFDPHAVHGSRGLESPRLAELGVGALTGHAAGALTGRTALEDDGDSVVDIFEESKAASASNTAVAVHVADEGESVV